MTQKGEWLNSSRKAKFNPVVSSREAGRGYLSPPFELRAYPWLFAQPHAPGGNPACADPQLPHTNDRPALQAQISHEDPHRQRQGTADGQGAACPPSRLPRRWFTFVGSYAEGHNSGRRLRARWAEREVEGVPSRILCRILPGSALTVPSSGAVEARTTTTERHTTDHT